MRALEASNWVVGGRNGAAERLGMQRTSLVYRMRKLRINRPNIHYAKGDGRPFVRDTNSLFLTMVATADSSVADIRHKSVSTLRKGIDRLFPLSFDSRMA